MRICFYTFAFLPTLGGAEIFLHRLASSLASRGHEVTVWAPRATGAGPENPPYRLLRYPKPFSKRYFVRLPLMVVVPDHRRTGYEVLHAHGGYPEAYVCTALKARFGIPMAVRPHGSDVLPGEWIRKHQVLEGRLVEGLRAADRVIAQGKSFLAYLSGLGVAAEKISIIHNGVDVPPSPPEPTVSAGSVPYLFSMGSLSQKKGYDVLLHALTRVPQARLKIAGDGSGRSELEALAADLGLFSRVEFLGEVDDTAKRALFAGAAGYVCSSRREPFSNSLLEAMASGKAIVATAVGGNVEMIEDGVHGILVPPENAEHLASGIQRVLENTGLRGSLARKAYERSKEFEWSRTVDAYERVYVDLGGQKK